MKKSISDRFKITKTGKVLRRKMGQSHFRAKKRSIQKRRKKGFLRSKLRAVNLKF